ncbi:hypothetical protein RDWZM_009924 [Blomia tropicalis]|uniref:Uncharacterized protein n=1 Tax=Blomia tropicalis TaxID=40697 RepID=A0A9Q0RI68_BLOTA|nr:hypothetical protein RDWZM_009924 [Blomia tropicalis]
MAQNNNDTENSITELMDKFQNISQDELIRGNTPTGIEQRCLELCKSYIGGRWSLAKSVNDLKIERISGGFTNQLFHVQLDLKDNTEMVNVPVSVYGKNEPTDVAIKFYLEKHMKNYNPSDTERLNDTIILTIMSQLDLGPKIYGIFNDGFIQGFYKHEQFRAKHQQDPEMVRKLVRLSAQIANLDIPIYKEPNLLLKEIHSYLNEIYDQCRLNYWIEECNFKSLKSVDIRTEYENMMKMVDEMNIPNVFVHYDFRGSNLLVIDSSSSDGSCSKKILACDLEYCGYGSRMFDLACILFEWGKTDLLDVSVNIPSDEMIASIIQMYIEECDRLVPGYSQQIGNSLDEHVRQCKVMILVNQMFFTTLIAKQRESVIPSIPFDAKQQMAS